MTRDISQIHAEGSEGITLLIQEAYEAGRIAGAADAKRRFQSKLASLLSDGSDVAPTADDLPESEQPSSLPEKTSELVQHTSKRASPGSVKPQVAALVAKYIDGISAEMIAQVTGFKFNSVRGTLWTLGNEGVVERQGSKWYAVRDHRQMELPPRNHAGGSSDTDDWLGPLVHGTQGIKAIQNTEEAEPDSSQEQPATSGEGNLG